ncbi:MAG: D-beta-hydroxybutyrate permease [Firmicutes bacterium]|nr:D-beta-hydroxybutyrate permease [Bacillota bacterium]
MTMISLIGIFVATALYIWLIFVGYNVWILSVLASVVVCVISGADLVTALMGPYMTGFAGFIKSYFLLFVTSAVLGRLVSDAGIAYSLGNKLAAAARKGGKNQIFLATLVGPILTCLLTLSGVSLFVVVFTLVFILRDLYKELDIPWHFYGFGVFGTSTITLGMLPGSPQFQNLIPMKYFGTTPMAAPMLGFAMAIVMTVLGLAYMKYSVNRAIRNGEHYLDLGKNFEAYVESTGQGQNKDRKMHPVWKCVVPLCVPFIMMNGLKQDPVISLIVACIVVWLMFRQDLPNIKKALNEGCMGGFAPALSVSAATGFGAVVATMPGFKLLVTSIALIPGPPVLQLVIAVAVGAGITGSASAGQTIALNALAKQYIPLVDAEVAHRLTAAASFGGFTPHNGGVFGTLAIIRVSHKDIYHHYAILGGVIPGIVTFIGVFLAGLGVK